MKTSSQDSVLFNSATLLQRFQTVMLSTLGADQRIETRPMLMVSVEPMLSAAWLVAQGSSGAVRDVRRVPWASVSAQDGSVYVVVGGRAELIDDAKVAQGLWISDLKAYFSGPDDPDLRVMRVVPQEVEYWDTRAPNWTRFSFASVREAVMSGRSASEGDDAPVHGHIELA